MSLKRLAGWGSFVLFFCLLAWYTRHSFREVREDMLICTWNSTFHRLDGACIYWITMRLAAWILLYVRLLRLESGFSVYLFLRQKSYGKVFARAYGGCVWMAVCYFCIGTLIMAVCHGVAWQIFSRQGAVIGGLLYQTDLVLVLMEEGLEALSFCLAAYAVQCLFRKAEVGFLVVLAGRLAWNLVSDGGRPGLSVQLAVNLGLLGLVFFLAFHNFAEKFIDG